jgi:hypothetical protein
MMLNARFKGLGRAGCNQIRPKSLKTGIKTMAFLLLRVVPLRDEVVCIVVPKSDTEIFLLQAAIKQLHGCEAVHHKTVFVDEKFEGNNIWKGEVEVFNLKGHPKAARCYAWMQREAGKGVRTIALLERWPVDSPCAAVKFAIAFNFSIPTGDGNPMDTRSD